MIYDIRRLTNADVAPSRRDARCVLFEFRVWAHSIRFVCMHGCIAKSHSFILTPSSLSALSGMADNRK